MVGARSYLDSICRKMPRKRVLRCRRQRQLNVTCMASLGCQSDFAWIVDYQHTVNLGGELLQVRAVQNKSLFLSFLSSFPVLPH